jgi:hypothetical protein
MIMRAFLLFTMLASVSQVSAQQSSMNLPSPVLGVLHQMKSSDQAERERAFNIASTILASDKASARDRDLLSVGLIQLLIAENALNNMSMSDEEQLKNIASHPGCGDGTDNCEGNDEEDLSESDYLPRLTATVAVFCDERAIPALVGAMTMGDAVTTALLRFGEKALGPVVEQLKNRNPWLRMSALNMSIKLLEARNDPASRIRTKGLIESSLTDPSSIVRENAIEQIICRDDRQDFLPILERIAKTDPLKLSGKALDGGDGEEFYPVRSHARQALRAIQNTKGCL